MTNTAAGAREGDRFGPGTLLLVVGPSGAGKDTLIDIARVRFAGDARVLFARRLVTRPSGTGEAHGTLSEAEFDALLAEGRFPLSWRAHGLSYALGPEVAEVIAQGGVVVANGSRATLPEARRRFARV
ncbi:phosphonate metabolism protein/1,5-bisphosphokinase (PRPP-forming) PhnN, partial [Xanthobacter autotrophicus]